MEIKKNLKAINKSLFVLFALVFFAGLVYASYYYRVGAGEVVDVDEWGVCRKVDNQRGQDIFVPTKTETEWNSFINAAEGGKVAGITIEECAMECKLSNALYHKSWIHDHTSVEQDNVCKNDFGDGWEALRSAYELDASYLWTLLKEGDATKCYMDWTQTGPHGYEYRGYTYGQRRVHIWGKDSYCDSNCWKRTAPEPKPAFCDRNEICTEKWCRQTDGWGAYYKDDTADHTGVNKCGTWYYNYNCNRDPNLAHIICCR